MKPPNFLRLRRASVSFQDRRREARDCTPQSECYRNLISEVPSVPSPQNFPRSAIPYPTVPLYPSLWTFCRGRPPINQVALEFNDAANASVPPACGYAPTLGFFAAGPSQSPAQAVVEGCHQCSEVRQRTPHFIERARAA